uniref:Uncharacterized protein n=1 Tax=Anguilla anguilla TaxID=7936 RepID=A0A0E9XX21_ANGAN
MCVKLSLLVTELKICPLISGLGVSNILLLLYSVYQSHMTLDPCSLLQVFIIVLLSYNGL